LKLAIALAATVFATAPTAMGADPSLIGIGFICGAEGAPAAPGGAASGVMLKGVGNGSVTVDTANPEAAAWFNQGLQLYHAFAHDETKAAFARAAAADPNCSLCASGVALSLGPTLNTGMTPQEAIEARKAADRAAELAKPDDVRARGLAAALQIRHGAAEPAGGREKAFARALDDMVRTNPRDDMIASLAAHALIIPARQDDYSGVPRAVEILDMVLARSPDDAAAIHYYIHATEFAGRAPQAERYAERLADLAPGAGHLVHMGTHTLMRVGRYEDVALSNARALEVDSKTQVTLPTSGSLAQRYYLHNYLFGLGGALMAGDGRLAVKYADHAPKGFAEANERNRSIAKARSLIALARFAPERVFDVEAGKDDPKVLTIYRLYARGEAYAARRDAAGARREADALAVIVDKGAQTGDFGGEGEVAAIARDVLRGRAAMVAGKPDEAVPFFEAAAKAQEKAYPVLRFFDPPPWWYPVRRSLAAAHLKAGRKDAAAQAARASLAEWPRDALALRILADATGDAAQHREARKIWRGGDLAKVPLDLT
jgi:tetratricopeptide (TPR) repeat protein